MGSLRTLGQNKKPKKPIAGRDLVVRTCPSCRYRTPGVWTGKIKLQQCEHCHCVWYSDESDFGNWVISQREIDNPPKL
jgi:hypothetical protein